MGRVDFMDMDAMDEFERYKENLRENNEFVKGIVLLLRQLMPEVREAVTARIDMARLKEIQIKTNEIRDGKYFNDPLMKIAYESGRADGMFGTILSLLLV